LRFGEKGLSGKQTLQTERRILYVIAPGHGKSNPGASRDFFILYGITVPTFAGNLNNLYESLFSLHLLIDLPL
jgi:hypothetical protein